MSATDNCCGVAKQDRLSPYHIQGIYHMIGCGSLQSIARWDMGLDQGLTLLHLVFGIPRDGVGKIKYSLHSASEAFFRRWQTSHRSVVLPSFGGRPNEAKTDEAKTVVVGWGQLGPLRFRCFETQLGDSHRLLLSELSWAPPIAKGTILQHGDVRRVMGSLGGKHKDSPWTP